MKSIFNCSNLEEIKTLLEKKEVNVDEVNIFGQTRLMIEDNIEIAKLLIEYDANIKATCSRGNSIFFYNKSLPVLKLVSSKLSLDEMLTKNKKCENPLFRQENIDFEKFINLFKEKAKQEKITNNQLLEKLESKDVFLRTALLSKNNIENIKTLVELGFDINTKDLFNNTVIYGKDFINNQESIDYLFSKNYNPLAMNQSGQNLLILTKNMAIFENIVKKFAPEIINSDGLELIKMIRAMNGTKRIVFYKNINLNKTNIIKLDLNKIQEHGYFNKNLIENIKINMLMSKLNNKELESQKNNVINLRKTCMKK